MKEVRTAHELIDLLDKMDSPNDIKRSIYFDIVRVNGFSIVNRESLLARKRKYPVYSVVLPDDTGIVISGELRNSMIKEAKSKVS